MQPEYHSNTVCATAVGGLKKAQNEPLQQIFAHKLLIKNQHSVVEKWYNITKHIIVSIFSYTPSCQ